MSWTPSIIEFKGVYYFCEPSIILLITTDVVTELRWKLLPLLALIVHYSVFLGMVVYGYPEREVSVGLHEPVGPCNTVRPVQTVTGVI